jgi:hypothetical protein
MSANEILQESKKLYKAGGNRWQIRMLRRICAYRDLKESL